MASLNCTRCALRDSYCSECYFYKIGFEPWNSSFHATKFTRATDKLFGTLLLGIERLEKTGILQLADAYMLEEMLECWQINDDIDLYTL